MKLLASFIAGFCLCAAAYELTPANAEEPLIIEYHHTEYIYPRDDLGLKYVTIRDIEALL